VIFCLVLLYNRTLVVQITQYIRHTHFILEIDQFDAQNLFFNKFISCHYMFRALCAHRQEVQIVLYSFWYHHTETSEFSKFTKIYKYDQIVVKFTCEFFGCNYCVLLTINML